MVHADGNVHIDISNPKPAGSFVWRPAQVLNEFPTNHAPNISRLEALAYGGMYKWGYLAISQPSKFADDRETVIGLSYPFVLYSETIDAFIGSQYERGYRDDYHRWKLGVALGLGLGGPLVVMVFWVVGYQSAKRSLFKWKRYGKGRM
jgi:hypothetical protein